LGAFNEGKEVRTIFLGKIQGKTFEVSYDILGCYAMQFYTGRFVMFSVITNIYNKKTPNAYATLHTVVFDIASSLAEVPLISSNCTENRPEPVQRYLQRLMGDHLISACTDTQFQ
jgi:hypothetical protein